MENFTYPQTPINKLGRKPARGSYDYDSISSILNSTLVSHVSFNPPSSPFPSCLPMICRIASYADSEPAAYIHGYISARMFRLPKDSEDGQEEGLPVCITATKVDGLVLALAPFNHSYHYRSAVVYGYANLLPPESEENMWAMQLMTDGVVPQRWDNSRTPPTAAEMKSTSILKVRIHSASAKTNANGVSDDRKDLKDEEMRKRVWTGVVPVYEVLGEPLGSRDNLVGEVPGYLGDYVRERNEGEERGAREGARGKEKKGE